MPQAILGSVVSGAFGMISANSAANAQKKSANDQMALARETRDLTRADLAPYVQSGDLGQAAYLNTLGLGAAPMVDGKAWGGYEQSPGYQTQLRQGTDSALSAAMATGQGASGRTLQDLNTFGQGLAAQDFGNFQNRLAALGQGGQAAAGMQANNNTNYAQMGTNALGALGNARSAGAIGVGNAFSDMMGNIVGGMGMMKAQNTQNTQPNGPSYGFGGGR